MSTDERKVSLTDLLHGLVPQVRRELRRLDDERTRLDQERERLAALLQLAEPSAPRQPTQVRDAVLGRYLDVLLEGEEPHITAMELHNRVDSNRTTATTYKRVRQLQDLKVLKPLSRGRGGSKRYRVMKGRAEQLRKGLA